MTEQTKAKAEILITIAGPQGTGKSMIARVLGVWLASWIRSPMQEQREGFETRITDAGEVIDLTSGNYVQDMKTVASLTPAVAIQINVTNGHGCVCGSSACDGTGRLVIDTVDLRALVAPPLTLKAV